MEQFLWNFRKYDEYFYFLVEKSAAGLKAPRGAAGAEPQEDVRFRSAEPVPGRVLTQHTGLPPRTQTTRPGPAKAPKAAAKRQRP